MRKGRPAVKVIDYKLTVSRNRGIILKEKQRMVIAVTSAS